MLLMFKFKYTRNTVDSIYLQFKFKAQYTNFTIMCTETENNGKIEQQQ
jgi:hypothetical protein